MRLRIRPLAISLCASLASSAASAQGSGSTGGVSLAVPVQAYDFRKQERASPSQRLRDAPVPDPSSVRPPQDSLHDANTGADTTAFGTAYSYANPLYGTTSGESTIAGSASRSAGLPQMGGGLVLFEWGFPPKPMPKVPGDDLTAAPPPVVRVRYALQADDQPVLSAQSHAILQKAVQSYGRAGLTEITIERPLDRPGCCAGFPTLVKATLIGSGIGPGPERLLPGHRIRLVLADLPK